MTIYAPDDNIRSTPTVRLPAPIPEPVGWKVKAGDGQMPVVVRHDPFGHPRTLDMKLGMTNETFPCREYIPSDDKVVQGKVIVPLWKKYEWIRFCREFMGPKVWERFVQPGDGFCDTNEEDTDPINGEIKLGVIDCGGVRRNVTRILENGSYAIVQHQPFQDGPNAELNYENAPHLHNVKVLVGDTPQKSWFIRTDPKQGDTYWPFISCVPVAHQLNWIDFYPKLPFNASLYNVNIVISKYIFSGSNTYGFVDGFGWYELERMDPTGNNQGWMVNVSPWVLTCPAPVVGWTRQE